MVVAIALHTPGDVFPHVVQVLPEWLALCMLCIPPYTARVALAGLWPRRRYANGGAGTAAALGAGAGAGAFVAADQNNAPVRGRWTGRVTRMGGRRGAPTGAMANGVNGTVPAGAQPYAVSPADARV